MNTLQHDEQLFTDLTSTQAETIAAGLDDFLHVGASYGGATAKIRPSGINSISGSLEIKDWLRDGYPVYAKFQGKTSNGVVLTSSAEFVDRRGASGRGTLVPLNKVSFGSKNTYIRYVRLLIYQKRRGNSLSGASDWADLDSLN
ncbi:hypothetical protein HJG54_25135 [Leptolyngbya sp. NK1-12]|uniref:Uncharacterized protein n=1 Tax=Leptolyngbya sp. NK1-12 TaxID=2547451 RepID=A0AA96WIH7_9CYAN|nr:hypothetical protein [Leptolyngbya sp. NK1-12]WNZ25795.1 hypothetical protein HJG54_25135 [Leptolyngbya sp. NK1-12]